jgi:NAD(P)-dependent dehydrogenase (short-subunit alcohol dehydrogenase family)
MSAESETELPHWVADGVAVVTGAGSGIGLALATRFAAAGLSVVLADIDAAAAAVAAADLESSGASVLAAEVDVADPDSVQALAEMTMSQFGKVNVLCNNAGVSGGGPSWEIPLDEWRWTVDVNLYGVVYGIHHFVPHIIASGGGHVVNTASMAGLVAAPGMGPYNATKHAVVGLSETMFHELAGLAPEVGVSVLCPGWVNTAIASSGRNRQDRYGGPSPVPEGGEENPVAEMITALISSGLDPNDVADLVWDAILSRRFWVFTHPDWLGAPADRFARAFDGRNPELIFPGVTAG